MMNRVQAALALALPLLVLTSTNINAIGYGPAATIASADSFESWLNKIPSRRAGVRAFEDFLAQGRCRCAAHTADPA